MTTMTTRNTFSRLAYLVMLLAIGSAIYSLEVQPGNASNAGLPGSPNGAVGSTQEKRQLEERELKELMAAALEKESFAFRGGDKPVKGAPFSAQVIVENTQTLAGGAHISRKMTGALYRDSEGRIRQEQPRDGDTEIVLIDDSVAGVIYKLHMFQHTAHKVTYGALEHNREMERNQALERRAKEKRQAEESGSKFGSEPKNRGGAGPQRRTESLGTLVFEGVQAEGTRVTITVPAGKEGNDQPFDIVSEKWYSPELQMVVMTRHSDPRMGDNVYRLANINRGEQPHSLFEAPADFTPIEEKGEERGAGKQKEK